MLYNPTMECLLFALAVGGRNLAPAVLEDAIAKGGSNETRIRKGRIISAR